MNTVRARIHSLEGNFDDVKVIANNGDNNIIVDYKGKKCTAIYNVFAGCYYVDDIYGVIEG